MLNVLITRTLNGNWGHHFTTYTCIKTCCTLEYIQLLFVYCASIKLGTKKIPVHVQKVRWNVLAQGVKWWKRANSSFLHLFHSGPRWRGWCLLTSEGYSTESNSNVNLIQKYPHRHTQKWWIWRNPLAQGRLLGCYNVLFTTLLLWEASFSLFFLIAS